MQKKIPLLLTSINFFIIFAAGFLTPVWAEFVQNIGGDIRTAGNAICIFSVILGFFTWIAAKIEQHFHANTWIVLFSQGAFVGIYFSYFFVHAPFQLYLVQIGLGIAGAIQVPALFALYQQTIPKGKATFYWGIWSGSYNIAMGLSALVSAYIVHHFGFKTMFTLLLSCASFCFALTLLLALLLKNSPTKAN